MDSLQGHLLVASPDLQDSHFAQSVVLIVQHDEEGTLGVIINRPGEMNLSEAWKQVSEEGCSRKSVLHEGGPCEGPLIALHTHAEQSQIDVGPGIFFSTQREALEWLVESGKEPIKFIVGFAGWSPGQLEGELKEGAWQVMPVVRDWVFHTPVDLWDTLIRRQTRPRYQGISDDLIPPDPSWN